MYNSCYIIYQHTHIQTNIYSYIHTHIHTYSYIYIHTFIHTEWTNGQLKSNTHKDVNNISFESHAYEAILATTNTLIEREYTFIHGEVHYVYCIYILYCFVPFYILCILYIFEKFL